MDLSLNELCLMSVCNSMIDGILPNNLQSVSTRLRRLIFETLIARQKLSDRNCLKYMEDLLLVDDSLCAIEALPKQEWLHRRLKDNTYNGFVHFLQKEFEKFPGLVDCITTLRLATMSTYTGAETISIGSKYYSNVPKDLGTVLQLISRCRNLKHLSLVNGWKLHITFPNWLEALAEAIHCSGSSGLETLDVTCCGSQTYQFEPTSNQRLAFRRLKSLRLQYVGLRGVRWTRLLECCHETLENLVLCGVRFDFVDVIPITLDELTWLVVDRVCSKLNLTALPERCPKLRSCHIDLNTVDMTDDSVSAIKLLLSSLVNCSVSLLIRRDLPAFLNDLLDAAGDKITDMALDIQEYWTEEILRHLILDCRNLSFLDVWHPTGELNAVLEKCLRDLFRNEERAGKLLKLKLHVSLSDETLENLFTNCINLELLSITGKNAHPSDRHFKIWTENGARPSSVRLESSRLSGCGLKLFISASGSNLMDLRIDHWDAEDVDSVYETLMRSCPMLNFVQLPGISDRILPD